MVPPAEADGAAARAAMRLRRNVKISAAIAASQGVRSLFVIQPSPAYQYDLQHHLFARGREAVLGQHSLAANGYEDLAREPIVVNSPLARTLWLADLQASRQEDLYVDLVHYSAAFSREVAQAIAKAATELP